MSLSRRIRLMTKSLTDRDVYFFRKDLKSFQELISRMREASPKASILDCIQGYNNALEKLILKTNTIRSSQVYRYIALESLLNSRDYGSIINRINPKGYVFFANRINSKENASDKSIEFTGNLENDYESLIKSFFYSEYILKYNELKDYLKKYPNDRRIQEEFKEIEDHTNKIVAGKLSAYDYNKIQRKEKAYFQELRKMIKVDLTQILANNIYLKIDFLRQIGALNNYENEYNHTLEKLSMPSSFRINDKKTFEQELLDKDKLKNYSISELVALNAFWTNRLVKEVERRNEVIYVLQNSNNFMDFSEGKEFELIDEDIMYYLAEYRAIVPYITKFKNDKRNSGKAKSVDKNSNLATVVFDIKEIFEQEDIDYYGFNDLDAMAYNVLLLNNRSQLLYDQKDIAIQEMISFIVNTNEYRNAGISFESDEKENTNKPLIVIDLKGFNAPLMLHMIKGSLTKNVKNVSGKDAFPVYRGGKDIIINSTQEGKYSAKTNVLFKLNSQQRKDISARAGLVGPIDTNARYVTHISWMLNPKKDMPELIREPKKVISLETGEITDVEEEQVRRK